MGLGEGVGATEGAEEAEGESRNDRGSFTISIFISGVTGASILGTWGVDCEGAGAGAVIWAFTGLGADTCVCTGGWLITWAGGKKTAGSGGLCTQLSTDGLVGTDRGMVTD